MAEQSEIQSVSTTGNIYVDSLLYPYGYVPGTVITYVLRGNSGDTALYGGAVWAAEGRRAAFALALQSWAAVANVVFQEAAGPYTGAESTAAYDWTESFAALGAGVLGQHQLPVAGTIAGTFSTAVNIFVAAALSLGGYGYTTFVHEIGHGLGLLHPHNEPGDPQNDPAFPGVGDNSGSYGADDLNQGVFTVMTYLDGYWQVGLSPNDSYGYELGPMAFDIAAIQHIYGANAATNAGASTFTLPQVNAAGTGWSCIWDAGGTDTIQAGATALDCFIDLRAATLLTAPGGGGFVSRIGGVLGGFTIANGVTIENATGGNGDDFLHGNVSDNVLNGGAGWDTADYSGTLANVLINLANGTSIGDGSDTLIGIENARGGAGDDVLLAHNGINAVGDALDMILLQNMATSRETALDLDYHFSAHGSDPTIQAAAGMVSVTVHAAATFVGNWYSFFLPSAGAVQIDIDNSFGMDTAVAVFDANGAQLGTNDDRGSLDPGSANILDSSLTLNVAQGGQRIYVRVNGGTGLIGTYDLNISTTTDRIASGTALVGSTLDGGLGNDALYGAAGIDTLIGGFGDDTLTGGGGADVLIGGNGNDSYYVDQQADRIIEGLGDGYDTVFAAFGYYLTPGVEGLRLAAGAGNIFGVGTDSGDNLFGNEGDNLLIGGGGFDYLGGGEGNDTLYGEAGDNQLYGEAGNDILVGGANHDVLDGGTGNDLLYGGGGSDSYFIDSQGDITFEVLDADPDTVFSWVSYAVYANIENLELVGGTAALFGVGNDLNNQIRGNANDNLLLGGAGNDSILGGYGNDVMYGEAGADRLQGAYGLDHVDGGDGADVIEGDQGADALFGGADNDQLFADSGPMYDPYAGASIDFYIADFVTDILVGGDGDDTLYANSGLGDYDLLDGGAGDDTYIVDTGDDLTFEAAGGGTDWVQADVRVANAGVYLYANVENLQLIGTTAFGVGNALDNILIGNASGNWLLGGAGDDLIEGHEGNDVLFGQAGADTFLFGPGYNAGGDVIGDFTAGTDTIQLSDSYSGLHDFAAVSAHTVQVGADCAIDLGNGNLIVLLGVQMSTLTAGDFLFA